jgi:hypothetical protein
MLLCASVMLLRNGANGENIQIVLLNANGTAFLPISTQANTRVNSGDVTEKILFICIYASTLLSFVPMAFAWLMHGDILDFVWSKLTTRDTSPDEDKSITQLYAAEANGSLFWLVNFIMPSVILTFVGMSILIWNVHGYIVATPFSIVLAFCVIRIINATARIGKAVPGNDLEEGIREN